MAGIRLNELIDLIEEHFPRELAMEWDNPGLLCGTRAREVKRLLISLDATDEACAEAAAEHCDLLLTHHPLIFGSIRNVNDESFIGRRLISLIKNDISLYAMHTNFDSGKEGMGHIVAERLSLKEICPMEITGQQDGADVGIGTFGELPDSMSAKELSELIRDRFSIGQVIYYDAGRPIKKAAICPGSGKGMMKYAKELHADAFITGDMGHHDGIDAVSEGITLIDAGHYGLEHIFVPYMKDFLEKHFPGIEIICHELDERRYV